MPDEIPRASGLCLINFSCKKKMTRGYYLGYKIVQSPVSSNFGVSDNSILISTASVL
jgi:hypothetical protein